MSIAQALLAEFEQEAKTTRKFLEQLPPDKLTWRPHEKSMTAGQLALHIAQNPDHVLQMALLDELVLPDFAHANPQPESVAQVLEALETGIVAVREKLPAIADERMHGMWRMMQGSTEVLAMPRVAVFRVIMLNHWYHHRGQFGVYLRLLGAKVPSSYGPSGDEMPDFAR